MRLESVTENVCQYHTVQKNTEASSGLEGQQSFKTSTSPCSYPGPADLRGQEREKREKRREGKRRRLGRGRSNGLKVEAGSLEEERCKKKHLASQEKAETENSTC